MSALSDPEDNFPMEPPSEPFREPLLTGETDTARPPPLDFSRMDDSAKLLWLCNTMQHVADEQLVFRQNLSVLNSRVGVPDGEDGGPSLFKKLSDLEERFTGVVGPLSLDVEAIRTHLLGKGASIHDLQRAEERRGRPAE